MAKRFRVPNSDLLREEPGRRAKVLVDVGDDARVEPDLDVVEEEVRGAGERTIGIRRELVTGAIHVQLLPTDEPFGVGQDDGTDRETSETELVGHEDLASPTD